MAKCLSHNWREVDGHLYCGKCGAVEIAKKKRLPDMNLLEGQTEDLPLAEFRKRTGDVIAQVQMGKVFTITKNGKAVAVLARPEPSALELAAACRAQDRAAGRR